MPAWPLVLHICLGFLPLSFLGEGGQVPSQGRGVFSPRASWSQVTGQEIAKVEWEAADWDK
eukprot:2794323-Ditylum_brightwellii.AAC.1